jgi:hypothetical protein
MKKGKRGSKYGFSFVIKAEN